MWLKIEDSPSEPEIEAISAIGFKGEAVIG